MTTTTNPLDGLLVIRDGSPTARWNFRDAVNTPVSSPGGIGNAATVSFSFWVSTPGYSDPKKPITEFAQFSDLQKQAARDVLSSIANMTHLSFTEAPGVGDITFAMNAQSGSSSYAYFPGFSYFYTGQTITSVSAGDLAGDVWLNSTLPWTAENFALGGSGYGTLVHELGHSLGLKHPFEAASAGGFILDDSLDNTQYTVMSYTPHPYSHFRTVTQTQTGYSWQYEYIQPETLMPLDIKALQYLYGANTNFHSGDDTYTFDTDRPFIKTIWDGGGNDTISVSNFSLGCLIDLRNGYYSSIRIPSDPFPPGHTETETNTGIYDGTDNLGIAYGSIIENAIGGEGNDQLFGNAAANTLIGNKGDDKMDGRGGADTMIGGDGSDTYYALDSADTVIESNPKPGSGGIDLVNSYLGSYTLGDNVENGRILTIGVSSLTGNDLNNTIYAGAGNNVLNGSKGIDTVSYQYASAAVTASLDLAGAQPTGGSGSDTLRNIENLTGSRYNDILTGSSRNNTINGGPGDDSMAGGPENDTYVINSASDIVSELTGQGQDLIKSTISYSLIDTDGAGVSGGNVENLTLTGNAVINGTGNNLKNILTGNNAANILTGNAGADKLVGGGGADQLTGGPGADILIGGTHADRFIFLNVSDSGPRITNRDTINDFNGNKGDRIDLSAIDADTSTAGNDIFIALQQGNSFTNSFINTASLYFDQTEKILYANNDNDAQADFSILLTGVAGIALSYLVL